MRGLNFHTLSAKGRFTSILKFRKQQLKEVVYVVKGLTKPLLRCPAIEELHLNQCIAAVGKEITPQQKSPLLFQGIGKIDGKCNIQLKDYVKSFALHVSTPTLNNGHTLYSSQSNKSWSERKTWGVIAKEQQPQNSVWAW